MAESGKGPTALSYYFLRQTSQIRFKLATSWHAMSLDSHNERLWNAGEVRLSRIPRRSCPYSNKIRTHRSLPKDASIIRPLWWVRIVKFRVILAGLRRHYTRLYILGTHGHFYSVRQSP